MRYVVPGLLGVCLSAGIILFGAVELHHASVVYGIAALLALIWAGKLFFAEVAIWKPSPMHWPVLGFVVYTFIHYFLSPYEYLSRMELFQVCLYALVYFIAANNVNRGRERTIVIGILIVVGTLEAMYGIWQAYTKSPYALYSDRPYEFYARAGGTYICPNHLAGMLEMVLGFALARFALYRPPERDSIETQVLSKVMIGYAVFVILAGVLFTFSRGGWAATVLGLMVFLVWGGLKSKAIWPRLAAGAAALCVFGLLLFSIPKARYYAQLHLSGAREKSSLPIADPSFNGRAFLWGATVKIIRDHPVFGTGVATWQWEHPKYRHPKMQFNADYAHSDVLQLTSDYGVLGLGLVIWTLAAFYVQARRLTLAGVTPEHRAFAVGAVIAVTILLLHSFMDFNLHIPANALLFCTILGLVAGMEVPDGPYSARRMNRGSRYLLGCALVIVVAAGVYFIVPAARAVHYTRIGDLNKKYLYWDQAIAWFEEAIALDPKYIRPRTKLADVYSVQAQFRVGEEKLAERRELAQKAIKHYGEALRLNPARSDVLAKLAAAHELAGDLEQARLSFEKALARDPNSIARRSQLALFLRRTGQTEDALRAFEHVTKIAASPFTDLNFEELRSPTPGGD